METSLTECPNCHAKLKNNMFSVNELIDERKTSFINAVNDTETPSHCNRCGDPLYEEARGQVTKEIETVQENLWGLMVYIPVISAQSPMNWDYKVLTMVTGQSVTGTGVFSEFVSGWTDLFGAQSSAYSSKLKHGENLCFNQLRKQALDLGGNAVIATDIDYSEVGGDKGMLMVCMAGTAVKLNNFEVLGEIRVEKFAELTKLYERLKTLKELKKNIL